MIPLKSSSKKSLESVVGKTFDTISQKIDDIELLHICSKLEKYTFVNTPSKLVNSDRGETILKDNVEIGGLYKSIYEDGIFIYELETLRGHGANVLAKLFCDLNINVIYGETIDDSYNFYKKFGAIFGRKVSGNMTTEFIIPRNKFFMYYKLYLKQKGELNKL